MPRAPKALDNVHLVWLHVWTHNHGTRVASQARTSTPSVFIFIIWNQVFPEKTAAWWWIAHVACARLLDDSWQIPTSSMATCQKTHWTFYSWEYLKFSGAAHSILFLLISIKVNAVEEEKTNEPLTTMKQINPLRRCLVLNQVFTQDTDWLWKMPRPLHWQLVPNGLGGQHVEVLALVAPPGLGLKSFWTLN